MSYLSYSPKSISGDYNGKISYYNQELTRQDLSYAIDHYNYKILDLEDKVSDLKKVNQIKDEVIIALQDEVEAIKKSLETIMSRLPRPRTKCEHCNSI